jgi:hypothetical protein
MTSGSPWAESHRVCGCFMTSVALRGTWPGPAGVTLRTVLPCPGVSRHSHVASHSLCHTLGSVGWEVRRDPVGTAVASTPAGFLTRPGAWGGQSSCLRPLLVACCCKGRCNGNIAASQVPWCLSCFSVWLAVVTREGQGHGAHCGPWEGICSLDQSPHTSKPTLCPWSHP